MDVKEFASLGGKARWKGTTKKQRKEAMKKVNDAKKKLHVVTGVVTSVHGQDSKK